MSVEEILNRGGFIVHYRQALERIATPEAFHLPTSNVDPEAYARMIYAEAILGGLTLERAEQKAKFETKERFGLGET